MIKLFLALLVASVIAIVIALALFSFNTRQDTIKPAGSRQLDDCPNTPNCVSSLATRDSQRIDPLRATGTITTAQWTRLIGILQNLGAEILVNDGDYCHAVFRSRIFRFKDDLELSRSEREIHIRSASRAGTSDMEVNRKRVNKIRGLWEQKQIDG